MLRYYIRMKYLFQLLYVNIIKQYQDMGHK